MCRSSPLQQEYQPVEHDGIRAWVEKFAAAAQITGCICFDFIGQETLEDEEEAGVFCIECNPRMHSAIVSFQGDPVFEPMFRYRTITQLSYLIQPPSIPAGSLRCRLR